MKYFINYTIFGGNNKIDYELVDVDPNQPSINLIDFIKNKTSNITDEAIKKYIKDGADINYNKTEDGYGPIHIATIMSNLDLIKILVHNGADINLSNRHENMNSIDILCNLANTEYDPKMDQIAKFLIDNGIYGINCVYSKFKEMWEKKWYSSNLKKKIFDNYTISEDDLEVEKLEILESLDNAFRLGANEKVKEIFKLKPDILADESGDKVSIQLSLNDIRRFIHDKDFVEYDII